MNKSVAKSLRDGGFVMEACYGNKNVSFELWVNHALMDAFVIWSMATEGKKCCYLAKFMSGTSEIILGSPTDDSVTLTTDWLGLLETIGQAFELAFPEEGSAYPDILCRAFQKAMENFDGGPLPMED
jgi:hypothetical protein